MQIDKKLQQYVEENIFPKYRENEKAHDIEHIKYVINRSFKLIKENNLDINPNIVYTTAAYHDIGHHINPKKHEIISAEIMYKDNNLSKFFNQGELIIIKEAIEDHRASKKEEPRNIYGKIVSSADRNTLIEDALKRTYEYTIKHNPNNTLDEIIEEARKHLIKKYGKEGYAKEKMYFKDTKYKRFLEEISILTENNEKFKKIYLDVNRINKK